MRLIFSLSTLLCLIAMPAASAAPGGSPAIVRVRITTSAGAITVALDARRAPKTTANFLAYVDDGRLDGTTFYRAARNKSAPAFGFIQGGIDTDARRVIVPPVQLEPTSLTGIRHLDATISMARKVEPNSATGNFILTVGPAHRLDAQGSYLGYAAFGRVVGGMDVVKRILAVPTGGGTGEMRGQMILRPIALISAKRLDGTPKPTGRPKPWLLMQRK